jgi:uncharacterized protein
LISEELFLFPEYRDLITKLKHKDHHFDRLFETHNDLDKQIAKMESHLAPTVEDEIEILKKKKLAVKDELFAYLKKVEQQS